MGTLGIHSRQIQYNLCLVLYAASQKPSDIAILAYSV